MMSESFKPPVEPNIALTIGRSEPPELLFNTLRSSALESLIGPSGLTAKCTAIVSPVGYGKTVLMSMLLADLRRIGKQCLWLTLDERDNTVDGIINEFENNLHRSKATSPPTHALFRGSYTLDKSIDQLINTFNQHPLPVIIFIDNINFCRDAALEQLLNHLLFRTRSTVQLVLSSTQELPLDMPRAQLEGLIRRVESSDLSFNDEEIATLLGSDLSQALGNWGVSKLQRKTEGWPAAARMAQIILANADEPLAALETFSGSDETLAQLLNQQVFFGFPIAIRQFLIAVAPLRTFCVALCNDAIGGNHVHEYIDYLIEKHVFVIPLDRNRRWYRLHGLFRDHLLREADTELPLTKRQAILRKAALWCDNNQYPRDAIDYALASGSNDIAIPILEKIAPSFVREQGAVQQYIQWIETFHQQSLQLSLEVEYWFVWALAFHRRYEQADIQINILIQTQQELAPNNKDLQRRIVILRASIDSFTDQLTAAYQGTSQWLATQQSNHSDAFDLTAAYCIQCCYFTNMCQFVEARHAIRNAYKTAAHTNSAYVQGWVACYDALIAVHEGNFVSAYSELLKALTTTREALGNDAGICGTMAMVAANCAAEMGLHDEARQLLNLGIKTSRTHGFLDAVACGINAALLLWCDNDDDPISLTALRKIAHAYPARLTLTLSCYLIRRLITLGRIDEACREAETIGLNINTASVPISTHPALTNALITLSHIELQIAVGRYHNIAATLAPELQRAKSQACYVNQVVLELNNAAIAFKSQQIPTTIRHVTRAILLSASRRILRPFNDHSDMLNLLIVESKPSSWNFATDEERTFFTDFCRNISTLKQHETTTLAALNEHATLLADLTARENELLQLIEAGLSNQQLADHLDIALPTIKWHLQNLYSKLGVSRRTAAVAKARRLKLLNN